MPFGNAVFTVMTHFNFEVADALLNTQMLQEGVDGVANAAQRAQSSLAGMSVGILSSMGALPASILGAVGASIKVSENFEQARLSWANLLQANQEYLSGPIDNFADRLAVSEGIMRRIVGEANKFGLDSKLLESYTKMHFTMFSPKGIGGADGDIEAFSTTFSRNLLKSAPNLGIDPELIGGQLQRAILGDASMSDPLIRRLAAETPAMKNYGSTAGVKALNTMDANKRVMILNESLAHFAKDAEIAEARANTLTGQLVIMKNHFFGLDAVLRPIGNVLRNLVVGALKYFNGVIDGPLRASLLSVGNIAKMIAPDIETAFLRMRHLQMAQEELNTTKTAVKTIMLMEGLTFGWSLLGKAMPNVQIFQKSLLRVAGGGIFAGIIGAFKFLPSIIKFMLPVLGFLGKALMWLGRMVLMPLAAIMFFSNIITRAKALANMDDMMAMPGLIQRFTKIGERFSEAISAIFGPISAGMDWWAQQLSFIFTTSFWMTVAADGLDWVADVLQGIGMIATGFWAFIETLGGMAGYVFQLLEDGRWKELAGTNFGEMFDNLYTESTKRIVDQLEAGKVSVKHQTNIGKVEIQNKFKENLEPDRIAFTIKDQLQKLGQNALQGRAQPSAYPFRGR